MGEKNLYIDESGEKGGSWTHAWNCLTWGGGDLLETRRGYARKAKNQEKKNQNGSEDQL